MSFDILGVDQNKAYNIKTAGNTPLPFDFHGGQCIDLIVGLLNGDLCKPKKSKKSKKPKKKGKAPEPTPADILIDFDLEICKASFDGKKFHIPDPHRTFARKTTMEPNRCAIVESYVKHFKAPGNENFYLEPITASRLASATINAVRKDDKFFILQMYTYGVAVCYSSLFFEDA